MARWTQYVGLSPSALEFLSKYKHEEIAKWKMTTGLCMEDVIGSIYEVHDYQTPGSDQPSTWAEVEDVTPWSSGPIIHTALRNLSTGEICFKWKEKEIHYD